MRSPIGQPEDKTEHMKRMEKVFPRNIQLVEPSYSITELVSLLNGKTNILFKTGTDEAKKKRQSEAIKETLRKYLNEATPQDEIVRTESGRNTKYPSSYIRQVLFSEKCINYLREQAQIVNDTEMLRLIKAAKDEDRIARDNSDREYDPSQDPSMVKITIRGPQFIEYYAEADGGFGDYLKEVLPEYKQRIINEFILEHFLTIDEDTLRADLQDEFESSPIVPKANDADEPEPLNLSRACNGLNAIEALENLKNYYEINTELLQALSIVSKLSPNILEQIIKGSKMKPRDK